MGAGLVGGTCAGSALTQGGIERVFFVVFFQCSMVLHRHALLRRRGAISMVGTSSTVAQQGSLVTQSNVLAPE